MQTAYIVTILFISVRIYMNKYGINVPNLLSLTRHGKTLTNYKFYCKIRNFFGESGKLKKVNSCHTRQLFRVTQTLRMIQEMISTSHRQCNIGMDETFPTCISTMNIELTRTACSHKFIRKFMQ